MIWPNTNLHRRNQRVVHATDLVLAYVRARAEDQLTRAIDGKASISQTVECVIETIFTEKVSAS